MTGRRPDCTILVWISVWLTWPKQPSLCCDFNHMFHALKTSSCSVFSTHRHPASTGPAHPGSVRADSSYVATKALHSHKLRDRHIYVYIYNLANTTRYQVHTSYIHACGVCGFFSGAWRWGSWRFQVASLRLQWTFLCPLHIIFPSWASVAGRVGRPHSEAPCISYVCTFVRIHIQYVTRFEIILMHHSNRLWLGYQPILSRFLLWI